MLGFEVELNGEKICTAGTGEFGVLTSGITWVNNRQQSSVENGRVEKISLNIGGLTIPENDAGEFVNWARKELNIGDKVVVRIVDATEADEPAEPELGDREPYCSFCGKRASDVAKIIKAQQVGICNGCVEICNRVIADNQEPKFGGSAA
jgi:hypothetical protein